MYSVNLMVEEHDNILQLLAVVRKACCDILEGAQVIDEDFRSVIDFARNYADKHHHGKEEQILFAEMSEHLGPVAVNLIQHGMLVEHDLGRLHITELEAALDRYKDGHSTEDKLAIITEAMGYANLLSRHIAKENQVVYTYAEKNLAPDLLTSVDERVREFEVEAQAARVQDQYLTMLKTLTEKYLGNAE